MDTPSPQPTRSHIGSPSVWLGGAMSLATLLSLLATWWWPLELLTHFRVQYLVILTPLVIVLLIRKHYLVAAITGTCLLLHGVLVAPAYIGSSPEVEGTHEVRLMVANVLTRNRDHGRFIAAVRKADPDLLVIMEIDDSWQASLGELHEEYRHGKLLPQSNNFGIGLLSKLPLESCEIKQLTPTDMPSIEARLQLGDAPLTIIGTHPLPPVGARAEQRNAQLEAVAELVTQCEGPVIVAGDLNVTPWSPYFRRLLRAADLHDSRSGFGVQATWPSGCGWAGIPIDHVLVSAGIEVKDRRVGDHVGSDHRPVIVDLRIGSK